MEPASPRCRSRGFTIVELLVVVVLLSFLATFASSFVTLGLERRSDAREVAEASMVAQLLSLAGVAVLLFGAGFWYLVELHSPGRLDRFRLGHFLLLASTYSLFFAVFAVLGSHQVDAWWAVAIAGGVSYPLLGLHVATIVDRRFALRSALPLAVLTTGIVVNGVYGGDVRSYVYLAMLCVVIALLTLTYPSLARGLEQSCVEREQLLARSVDEVRGDAAAARVAAADARVALALQDPLELEGMRQWLERRMATLNAVLDEHELLLSRHDDLTSTRSRGERRLALMRGQEMAQRLAMRLPQASRSVAEATAALGSARPAVDRSAPLEHGEHCMACGHECSLGARYCPGCGAPCAEARSCRRCHAVLRLPRHLLSSSDTAVITTHCQSCGEPHPA